MKQRIFYLVLTSFVIVLLKFIMTGFQKINDAHLDSFDLPDSHDRIILRLTPNDVKEHIRKVNIRREEGGKIYLECMSTFTSDKLTIGRREDFLIPIDETSTMIAVNRNDNCYEVLLEKSKNGIWQKPSDFIEN